MTEGGVLSNNVKSYLHRALRVNSKLCIKQSTNNKINFRELQIRNWFRVCTATAAFAQLCTESLP